MNKENFKIIIWCNFWLCVLVILGAVLFYSLILSERNHGYGFQYFFAFLLIPAMVIVSFAKVLFVKKNKLSLAHIVISISHLCLCVIPLTDAIWHNTKITYPLSITIYILLTIINIVEGVYLFTRKIHSD
jgi:peptidoglycan/LPS O-acetylase OafA/YrhL